MLYGQRRTNLKKVFKKKKKTEKKFITKQKFRNKKKTYKARGDENTHT